MKPKVLLVGCGEHSSENLIPSLASIASIAVHGLCDNDAAAAHRAARWFPGATVHVTEQLDSAQIEPFDAVVVAATPHVHEHVARLALNLGKPVFVEKPPAVRTEELVNLADIARRQRLITCVGHNLRHSDAAIRFRNAVSLPNFGRPVAMEMRYFASKPRGRRWGLESPLRSFLLSHANHAIDLMIHQMGPIEHVVAARASPEIQDGIAIAVQFIFRSGAVGNLVATSYAPKFSISATVVSDAGLVAVMSGLQEVQLFGDHALGKGWTSTWNPRTLETGFRYAGYQTELERFFIAIANNNPADIQPSFADEVEIYRTMDEIEQSVEAAN